MLINKLKKYPKHSNLYGGGTITGDSYETKDESGNMVTFSLEELSEINKDVQTNLYTNGGEYKTADGTEYIGFYHVHPSKGPMIGRLHTAIPHEKLYVNTTVDIGPTDLSGTISAQTDATGLSEIDDVEANIENTTSVTDFVNQGIERPEPLKFKKPIDGSQPSFDLAASYIKYRTNGLYYKSNFKTINFRNNNMSVSVKFKDLDAGE